MSESSGSSVPRRQLGRYLKAGREEAGLSLEGAARTLEWSKAKLYRIENGQSALRTHDVIAMCSVYGMSGELQEVLIGLAAETKARGWWHSYGDAIPDWFELYVGLEAAACSLRQFDAGLVPGLLQTESYAATVYRTKPELTDAQVSAAVSVRMERQQLLARRQPKAPTLEVILSEGVVRAAVPGHEGMQEQLLHLIKAGHAPNIDVRILPLAAGPHRASLNGNFVILDFPSIASRVPEPTTVYSELVTGALYLDKPAEVDNYTEVWQSLRSLALDNQASTDLMTTLIEEFSNA